MHFAIVLTAGLVATVGAFAASRRTAARIGRWWPYLGGYLVAAAALTALLASAWPECPEAALAMALSAGCAAAILHWVAWTREMAWGALWNWFWSSPWRWLRWALLAVLFYPAFCPIVIIIGLCLLVVAWPLRGLPVRVALPPLRELMRPPVAGKGVIRYRAWP
jgi:hypothetical protein